MLFVASKLLSAITQPVFWLALYWALALLLLGRRRRLATAMLWSALAMLVLLGWQVLPDALLRPLEARYAPPAAEVIAAQRDVIVLGGAIGHPAIYQTHAQVPLGDAAERMTLPVGWMHHHPHLELVFSGGEGRLLATGTSEAELAAAFYREQGIDAQRIRLESGSRNTRENAQRSVALLGPGCDAGWLLVTSASHMPRAMAEFDAVGCHVTPYPVDFHTARERPWGEYSIANSLLLWQLALHEWLGLAVYRWTR